MADFVDPLEMDAPDPRLGRGEQLRRSGALVRKSAHNVRKGRTSTTATGDEEGGSQPDETRVPPRDDDPSAQATKKPAAPFSHPLYQDAMPLTHENFNKVMAMSRKTTDKKKTSMMGNYDVADPLEQRPGHSSGPGSRANYDLFGAENTPNGHANGRALYDVSSSGPGNGHVAPYDLYGSESVRLVPQKSINPDEGLIVYLDEDEDDGANDADLDPYAPMADGGVDDGSSDDGEEGAFDEEDDSADDFEIQRMDHGPRGSHDGAPRQDLLEMTDDVSLIDAYDNLDYNSLEDRRNTLESGTSDPVQAAPRQPTRPSLSATSTLERRKIFQRQSAVLELHDEEPSERRDSSTDFTDDAPPVPPSEELDPTTSSSKDLKATTKKHLSKRRVKKPSGAEIVITDASEEYSKVDPNKKLARLGATSNNNNIQSNNGNAPKRIHELVPFVHEELPRSAYSDLGPHVVDPDAHERIYEYEVPGVLLAQQASLKSQQNSVNMASFDLPPMPPPRPSQHGQNKSQQRFVGPPLPPRPSLNSSMDNSSFSLRPSISRQRSHSFSDGSDANHIYATIDEARRDCGYEGGSRPHSPRGRLSPQPSTSLHPYYRGDSSHRTGSRSPNPSTRSRSPNPHGNNHISPSMSPLAPKKVRNTLIRQRSNSVPDLSEDALLASRHGSSARPSVGSNINPHPHLKEGGGQGSFQWVKAPNVNMVRQETISCNDDYKDFPFYFSDISREDAESKLLSQGCPDGLFLLRKTSQGKNALCLSICYNHEVAHQKVLVTDEGLFTYFVDKSICFKTMDALIDYFSKNPIGGVCPTKPLLEPNRKTWYAFAQ